MPDDVELKALCPAARRAIPAFVTIAVLLAAVGCYLNTLGADFVNWDDPKLILHNPYIKGLTWENLEHIWSHAIKEAYLPLRATSYALDYHLWGYEPAGFHLTNIILHAAVAYLVLRIAAQLSGSAAAGLFAGLLFAVHPVHTEAVAWASGRKDLLSTALFLFAYLLYLGSRRGERTRWTMIAASLTAFVLSGLAKAMVVTLPALVVLTDFVFGEGLGGGRWKRRLPVWAAYLAAAALITGIAVHFAAGAGAIVPWHFGGRAPQSLFMTWAALYYLKTLLWPNFLSARYPYGDTAEFGVPEWMVHASPFVLAAVLGGVVWLVLRTRGGRRPAAPWLGVAGFGLAWVFISLTPVMGFVSINVLVADRYLYLPSAGWVIAAAGVLWWLWDPVGATSCATGGSSTSAIDCCASAGAATNARVPSRRRWVTALLFAVLFATGAARTYARNRVWRDSLSLWSSVVAEFPRSAEARLLLASAYADLVPPRDERALEEIQLAEALAPADGQPHLVRARLYTRRGRAHEAYAEFAIGFHKSAKRREQMGDMELAAGYHERAGQARELLARALEADPSDEKLKAIVERVEIYTRGGQ